MSAQQQTSSAPSFAAYGGTAPENYERYFVPSIGEPMAHLLMDAARLVSGQHVLDVACGTGIVARLAAERVGPNGSVAGLDLNPGMLAVAQATPGGPSVTWRQGHAESLPFPDSSFDVILCQLGFQFFANKPAALCEMRRVSSGNGRMLLTVPGPAPDLFAAMEAAIALHIDANVAGFLGQVFSVHDAGEVQRLCMEAGFREVEVLPSLIELRLPPPAEFFWQYAHSTPLSGALAEAGAEQLTSLERDVVDRWQPFVDAHGMRLNVRVLTATGRK